jgi:phosphoglycolate phosphatase-like HAD superfamily hydrolase
MQIIKAVVFEPVGCLAEFPPWEFDEIAATLFDLKESDVKSGSGAYWRLLELMEHSGHSLDASQKQLAERLELQAVEQVELYEDASPALSDLKAMGIELLIASSLSTAAVSRFLEKFSLENFFSALWTRDNAGGVKAVPLARAIESASLRPAEVMCLVDSIDSIDVAKEVGANSILMINDYDEGRRLALHAPTGGIVSLHELPDAIRLVAENAKQQTHDRPAKAEEGPAKAGHYS